MSAGKGDKPRNCFSKNFRNNYDKILWKKKREKKVTIVQKNNKTIIKYA